MVKRLEWPLSARHTDLQSRAARRLFLFECTLRSLSTRHGRQPISESAILDAQEVTDVDGPRYSEGDAGRSRGFPIGKIPGIENNPADFFFDGNPCQNLICQVNRAPLAMSFSCRHAARHCRLQF